jgi:hypothetical protein
VMRDERREGRARIADRTTATSTILHRVGCGASPARDRRDVRRGRSVPRTVRTSTARRSSTSAGPGTPADGSRRSRDPHGGRDHRGPSTCTTTSATTSAALVRAASRAVHHEEPVAERVHLLRGDHAAREAPREGRGEGRPEVRRGEGDRRRDDGDPGIARAVPPLRGLARPQHRQRDVRDEGGPHPPVGHQPRPGRSHGLRGRVATVRSSTTSPRTDPGLWEFARRDGRDACRTGRSRSTRRRSGRRSTRGGPRAAAPARSSGRRSRTCGSTATPRRSSRRATRDS